MYKAAFVGAGMIGAGLAASAAVRNFEVSIYDVADLNTVRESFAKILNILVESGAASREAADSALKNTVFTNDLSEAVAGADFVQECVPERLELKRSTYAAIQAVTGPDAIIASATTALFPTDLQEGAQYPGSILVGHPYNPSYLLPLVEVCGGKQTSADKLERACQIYTAMGKAPIVCRKEVEGFLVNRLSWGVMHAAQECVREGLCTVEDIDRAIMFGPGLRMAVTGQLLTMSLGVEGGFRAMAKKYGKEPTEYDELYAQGVDAEIANRDPAIGNTVESTIRYRDRMFAEILKLQKLL